MLAYELTNFDALLWFLIHSKASRQAVVLRYSVRFTHQFKSLTYVRPCHIVPPTLQIFLR